MENASSAITKNQRALKCIIALLFGLAMLAERSGALPAPLRRFVFSVLLRAESVAYALVYWAARDCGAPLTWYASMSGLDGSYPEDAQYLAAWFRVLAVALRDLKRRAPFTRSGTTNWLGFAPCLDRPCLTNPAPQAPDTS